MHPDLSPHLHTAECNILIKALQDCHKENTFRKFLGHCNSADNELNKCLRKEREDRRKANFDKANATRSRIYQNQATSE